MIRRLGFMEWIFIAACESFFSGGEEVWGVLEGIMGC